MPHTDNADVIDSRLAGVISSDARVILLYATPLVRLFLLFYRAMHLSAKRGLAIAYRPSVRLSVTLVDCDHMEILETNCTDN